MFNHKLLELEAELLAKKQIHNELETLSLECINLLEFIEEEVEIKLADKVSKEWNGWLSYRRKKNSLIILRGKAFKANLMGSYKAGFDVINGNDSISEYLRGFDISPPQELDHLLINFGLEHAQNSKESNLRCFLWYGENIAAYKLIFVSDLADDPQLALAEMVVEACHWIMKRPKHITLNEFLSNQ